MYSNATVVYVRTCEPRGHYLGVVRDAGDLIPYDETIPFFRLYPRTLSLDTQEPQPYHLPLDSQTLVVPLRIPENPDRFESFVTHEAEALLYAREVYRHRYVENRTLLEVPVLERKLIEHRMLAEERIPWAEVAAKNSGYIFLAKVMSPHGRQDVDHSIQFTAVDIVDTFLQKIGAIYKATVEEEKRY